MIKILLLLAIDGSLALRLPKFKASQAPPSKDIQAVSNIPDQDVSTLSNIENQEMLQKLPKMINVMQSWNVVEDLKNAAKDHKVSSEVREKWKKAQMDMIEKTKFIREWRKDQGYFLFDQKFFEYFQKQLEEDPDFYTGFVYIPIPWHRVQELNHRIAAAEAAKKITDPSKTPEELKEAAVNEERRLFAETKDATLKVMLSLDPKLTYFTTMSQGHVGSLFKMDHAFRNVAWDKVLVFDSRGYDSTHANPESRKFPGQVFPRVPIPLLRKEDTFSLDNSETFARNISQKKLEVFFAGGCSGKGVRDHLGEDTEVPPGKLPNGKYEWEVHHCGKHDKLAVEEYEQHIKDSTWVITPVGAAPTAFMIYEALQAQSLCIIPYKKGGKGYNKDADEPWLWLPYHDIGVQWQHNLAELAWVEELPNLKTNIEKISDDDIRKRRDALKHVQPLFHADGVMQYILYMVKVADQSQQVLWDFGVDEGALGRSLDLVRLPTMKKTWTLTKDFEQ